MNEIIDLSEKLSLFEKQWTPHIVAELNGQYVKLAKLAGDFVWHSHEDEDELFMVIKGILFIELEDRTVEIRPGQIFVVPKGVPHRPYTDGSEVHVMLFEPSGTKHTGEKIIERTVREEFWI